jgi:23S rRNA (uracil1939-C5)-methyltransferase
MMRPQPRQHFLKERDEITLRLDAMTYGGDAMGRVAGKVIFVRGGIAGELVRAEIVEDRGQFARAQVLQVIEPAPDRVQPRCPYFGFGPDACGGCTWQHLDYAAQLRWKTDIVREQLRRIGRIENAPVRDAIPSPDAWAYRNHAEFSLTPDGQLGFQAARSNRVVPIDVCYIVQPPILDWLRTVGPSRTRRDRVDVRTPNFPTPTPDLQSSSCTFWVKRVPFRVSAGSFFQVNTSLIETLVDEVLGRLDLHGEQTVLDAYCGVGLFSRFIAPVAGHVIGIESSKDAMGDARQNLGQFTHVQLHSGLVEEVLPSLMMPLDAAVVDPPRAGCGRKVVQAVIDRWIERLVYVSCDPATLARDARRLIDGGYLLAGVQPLDMFPHTFHIETVSLWVRSK